MKYDKNNNNHNGTITTSTTIGYVNNNTHGTNNITICKQ